MVQLASSTSQPDAASTKPAAAKPSDYVWTLTNPMLLETLNTLGIRQGIPPNKEGRIELLLSRYPSYHTHACNSWPYCSNSRTGSRCICLGPRPR